MTDRPENVPGPTAILKCCPFCPNYGVPDFEYIGEADPPDPYDEGWKCFCHHCGTSPSSNHQDKEAATHDWNTRPIEDALREDLGILKVANNVLTTAHREAWDALAKVEEISSLSATYLSIDDGNSDIKNAFQRIADRCNQILEVHKNAKID